MRSMKRRIHLSESFTYRHQFYQQTLTLIETNAPENFVKSGVFYYCNDENNREHVTELLARQRLELKPYEYYKMDLIDHYFVKTYNRTGARGQGSRGDNPQRVYADLRVKSVGNTDPSLITGYTVCDSMDTLQNVYFIDSYEKAMAEAAGKDPEVVLISGDEVRMVADRLKYRKKDERRP